MQALCQGCERRLCAECTNKVSGINFCADCLPIPPVARAPSEESLGKGRKLRRAGVVVALLTCASLAVGYGVGRPLIEGFSTAERNERTVQSVQQALYSFNLDCDRYPTTEEGLEALVRNPGGNVEATWKQYLPRVPLDPWNNPFQYESPGQRSGGEFDLYLDSLGSMTE